jgi:hypothetical protein
MFSGSKGYEAFGEGAMFSSGPFLHPLVFIFDGFRRVVSTHIMKVKVFWFLHEGFFNIEIVE